MYSYYRRISFQSEGFEIIVESSQPIFFISLNLFLCLQEQISIRCQSNKPIRVNDFQSHNKGLSRSFSKLAYVELFLRALIWSLHNLWTICSQHYFILKTKQFCVNYFVLFYESSRLSFLGRAFASKPPRKTTFTIWRFQYAMIYGYKIDYILC